MGPLARSRVGPCPEDPVERRSLLTYGHLGRLKDAAGLIKIAADNWSGHDPLTVRSMAFWYPFQNSSDAEHLATGLRNAGVPD